MANKKPIDEVKLGKYVAAIWENQSENGVFYNATPQRLYKNAKGEWQRSTTFGRDDLLPLAKLAELTFLRITELSSANSRQEPEQEAA